MQRDCPRCGLRNREHRGMGCPMDKEMFEAIVKFATQRGRNWRSKLREAWLRGDDVGEELQRVRNVVGPTRLAKVKVW